MQIARMGYSFSYCIMELLESFFGRKHLLGIHGSFTGTVGGL